MPPPNHLDQNPTIPRLVKRAENRERKTPHGAKEENQKPYLFFLYPSGHSIIHMTLNEGRNELTLLQPSRKCLIVRIIVQLAATNDQRQVAP